MKKRYFLLRRKKKDSCMEKEFSNDFGYLFFFGLTSCFSKITTWNQFCPKKPSTWVFFSYNTVEKVIKFGRKQLKPFLTNFWLDFDLAFNWWFVSMILPELSTNEYEYEFESTLKNELWKYWNGCRKWYISSGNNADNSNWLLSTCYIFTDLLRQELGTSLCYT